jgi:hypothetical protein
LFCTGQIVAQDRIFRAFYRVKFLGAGFGADIRNKEFVYRSGNGANLESVKDFTDRIKKKFPEAIVSLSLIHRYRQWVA